jgi:hypothetical protein
MKIKMITTVAAQLAGNVLEWNCLLGRNGTGKACFRVNSSFGRGDSSFGRLL